MKLSVVATLYKSATHLAEFHERAIRAAEAFAPGSYEIVLVNDGSPDASLDMAIALTQSSPHLRVIDLSRNFGHHKAMLTGLAHAEGELVFLIDSDLEEEPEWLAEFGRLMSAERADVVYGVQQKRKGGWFERWSGSLYYALFNWLSNIDHPRNIVTARLMTRRYVHALLQFQEREVVISCLWVIAGFKQHATPVKKLSLTRSTYSLSRKIEQATDSLTSFSEFPLRLIFYVGIVILAASVVFTLYLVAARLSNAEAVDGWTSVMVSIWLLGGMIISFIGTIGIYLSKIFTETKQRPLTIVRAIYGRSNSVN